MKVLEQKDYLERCWLAEDWKSLAVILYSYTYLATDGSEVSFKRKIQLTQKYLKGRITTAKKIRELTGVGFKKRTNQIKIAFCQEVEEQMGNTMQLWHYNKKADEAGIPNNERMKDFVERAIKKSEKYLKLF